MYSLQFKSAYLIITHIDKIRENENYTGNSTVKYGYTYIHSYFNNNLLSLSEKIDLTSQIENKYWSEKIIKILLLKYQKEDDYFVTKVLYILSSDSIDFFIDKGKGTDDFLKRKELLRELIVETFPDMQSLLLTQDKNRVPLLFKSIKSNQYLEIGEKIFSYLILKPQEVTKIYESSENIINYLLEFEAKLGNDLHKKESVYIPYATKEFIETFESIVTINAHSPYLRIFIGNQLEVDSYLENGIIKMTELDELIYLFQHLNQKLSSKSLNNKTIQVITNSLINSKESLVTINQYFQENILEISSDLNEYKQLLERFDSQLYDKYVYSYELRNYFEIKDFIKTEAQFHSWSFVTRYHNIIENERKKLESQIIKIENKTQILVNFLNSFYLMNSTRMNFRIQRQIITITIVAIIFALFSIFTTIFSQEINSMLKAYLK